jgi:uncharacterized cupin superfamily protein
MSAYRTARLDEIVAEQWPYWAPVRHHFGISTFGVNAWRGGAGDRVITPHAHEEDDEPELYVVIAGAATFTVAGEEVEAPAVTFVWVDDPKAERVAFATADDTVVLSIGGGARGRAYEPSGWDTKYLEADT